MLRTSLRDINKKDLEKIFRWRNQEHIRNVMFNNSKISWDEHVNWYTNLQENKNKLSKIFIIDEMAYGVLNINIIDKEANICSWGFYIGENNSIKGAGLLLGYTSLDFIFKELKIRKLCAEVIETNKISCNFHEKLGFKLDGTLRKHIKRTDRYEDIYIYSLFLEEWEESGNIIKAELEERFSSMN